MSSPKRKGLGKGLDLLFEEIKSEENTINMLPIGDVEPNRDQPRKSFTEQSMRELADSIAEHGVIQPIIVREMPGGLWQIIAGERRWRAARMAGLSKIPAIIRDADDDRIMELAMIENLQREDLNPIEEAKGYQMLAERFGLTQEELAKRMGKSRSAVANILRLLTLPEKITDMVKNGELSAGHARALITINDEKTACEAALRVKKQGLSVRETERLAAAMAKESRKTPRKTDLGAGSYLRQMELALSQELGRKVQITGKEEIGHISFEYFSKKELEQIAQTLCKTLGKKQ